MTLLPRSVKRSFAVERGPMNVDVYWDPDCTQGVASIDWSQVSPGSTNNIKIFVRNEEGIRLYLYLSAVDWNPLQAANYITLTWDTDGMRAHPQEVVQSTLTLKVVRYVPGITDFSFNITIWGQEHLLGDVNRDEAIELSDAFLISQAFGSTPSDSNWNPDADLNFDDVIELHDFSLFSRAFHL